MGVINEWELGSELIAIEWDDKCSGEPIYLEEEALHIYIFNPNLKKVTNVQCVITNSKL